MSDVTLFNQPQIFNFNDSNIRVILENGEPLFCLSDVCKILGFRDGTHIKRAIDREFDKGGDFKSYPLETKGGKQNFSFITESELYFVLVRSDADTAKPFRQWVVKEVLPEIRKTGSYSAQHKLPQTYAEALLEAGRLALENEKLLAEAKENAPKVECYNKIMDSKDAIDFLTFSKLAKIGRNTLFKKCRELKILMSNNMPYQEFIDIGCFRVVESSYRQYDESKIYTKTLILPKGQAFLLKKLKLKKED